MEQRREGENGDLWANTRRLEVAVANGAGHPEDPLDAPGAAAAEDLAALGLDAGALGGPLGLVVGGEGLGGAAAGEDRAAVAGVADPEGTPAEERGDGGGAGGLPGGEEVRVRAEVAVDDPGGDVPAAPGDLREDVIVEVGGGEIRGVAAAVAVEEGEHRLEGRGGKDARGRGLSVSSKSCDEGDEKVVGEGRRRAWTASPRWERSGSTCGRGGAGRAAGRCSVAARTPRL